MPELRRLYAMTDWRFVLMNREIELLYGEDIAKPLAVIKAHALRYLLELDTEMALVRRLAEDPPLRQLCQYPSDMEYTETAIRPLFYRFRKRAKNLLSPLLLRALIALALSGQKPELDLPFVEPIVSGVSMPVSHPEVFELDPYRPKIKMWTGSSTLRASEVRAGGIPMHELHARVQEWQRRPPEAQYPPGQLPLPAVIQTTLSDGQEVSFRIVEPSWFKGGYHFGGKDTVTTLQALPSRPSLVCHAIVMRCMSDRREILLSRRLTGYAAGQWVLPGGKAFEGESPKACLSRELFEETRLRVVKSKPVSDRINQLPRKLPMRSIGFLISEYSGNLQHREPNQNSPWEWFPLDELPWPLFEPAKIVLRDLIEERFRDLSWRDIDPTAVDSDEGAVARITDL